MEQNQARKPYSRREPAQALAAPDDAAASRTQKLVAAGGILGAIAASACCIAPLALFSLGVSGAWIGNLTALAPYQPYFIAATVCCRHPRKGCSI